MSNNFGNDIVASAYGMTSVISINSNTVLNGTAYGRTYRVSGPYTVTLPTLISGAQSDVITIVNDTASNTVIVSAQGSDTIRVGGIGVATVSIGPGDSMTVENAGTVFLMENTDALKANSASPTFTGTPSAPTAAANTNSSQLATTAFVLGQASATNPIQAGAATAGSASTFSRGDHVHPNTAATPAQFDNTTSLATTAFVQRALGNRSNYLIFNSNLVLGGTAYGWVYESSGSAPLTLQLPSPSGAAGGSIIVYCAGTSTVTVSSASGSFYGPDQVNGTTAVVLNPLIQVEFMSDGFNWKMMNGAGAASLTGNGYQKLPSGLIIQWGTVVSSGTSNPNVTFNFPIAFPNSILSNSFVTGSVGGIYANFSSTVNQMTGVASIGGTITNGVTVSFLIVGY